MPQAVLIRVQLEFQKQIPGLGPLGNLQQWCDEQPIELEQLLAERIADDHFTFLAQFHSHADVLVRIVCCNARMGCDQAQLVPTLEVIIGVGLQCREGLLRVLVDQLGRLDQPQRIFHRVDHPLLFLEVRMGVVDFNPRKALNLPIHPFFEVG